MNVWLCDNIRHTCDLLCDDWCRTAPLLGAALAGWLFKFTSPLDFGGEEKTGKLEKVKEGSAPMIVEFIGTKSCCNPAPSVICRRCMFRPQLIISCLCVDRYFHAVLHIVCMGLEVELPICLVATKQPSNTVTDSHQERLAVDT